MEDKKIDSEVTSFRFPTSNLSHSILELFYSDLSTFENENYSMSFENNEVSKSIKFQESLFPKNLNEQEIFKYIDKHMGVFGLKNLFALLYQLQTSWNGRFFVMDVRKQFEICNYKLQKNRTYNRDEFDKFQKFYKFMISTIITITYKDSPAKKKKSKGVLRIPLFMVGESLSDNMTNEEIKNAMLTNDLSLNEKVKLYLTDWLIDAFGLKQGLGQEYTNILLNLAQEDGHLHSDCIKLVPQIYRYFRISKSNCYSLPIDKILNMIGFKDKKNFSQKLQRLKNEFDYMVTKGHIKSWNSKQNKAGNEIIEFISPDWVFEQNSKIAARQDKIKQVPSKNYKDTLSIEEIKEKIIKSNLSQNKFCETYKIDKGLLSKILNGKKPISKKLSDKIQNIN